MNNRTLYKVKIGLLLLFGLVYCLSYWPVANRIVEAYSDGVSQQQTNPTSKPEPKATPPSTTQPTQATEVVPTVATAESIAAKYGSLKQIPIHQVHKAIKITDATDGKVKQIECLDCHVVEDGAKGRNSLRYLAKVDCAICHNEDNDERQKYPHPPIPTQRETLSEYSHAAHIDPLGRISTNGQRQDCAHCHNPSAVKVTMPTHPECYGCHSGPKAAKPIFNSDSQECRGCHSEEKIDRNMLAPNEGRAQAPLILNAHASYRDVNVINHAAHLKEANGKTIGCLQCHEGMLRKSSIDQYAQLPTMNECATCHSNVSRTKPKTQMENCVVCHREVTTGLLPFTTAFNNNKSLVSPASAERSMPIDHTSTFRINHEAEARQPNNRCSSCHTGIDKFAGDNCTTCHNVMQPRSHTPPRFRDIDHGRFAAMSRSNCAVCHSTEFCARCHTLLPRDHQPLGVFAGGIHKFQARANMRSCFTCHTYENTCQPCHVSDANGPISKFGPSAMPVRTPLGRGIKK